MSQETTRSSGPFELRENDGPCSFDKAIFDADGNQLLSFFKEGYDTVNLDDGDWTLLAAAPEMLEALKVMTHWNLEHAQERSSKDGLPTEIRDALAAIAKAEGRVQA
jgi:hypothetical protein